MKRGATALLAVILIIVTSVSAMAAGLDEKKNQLKDVNSDIKETKEQLEQVRQEQSQINTQLQTIEAQLGQKEKELKNVEQQLKDTQQELEITRKELEQAIEEAKNQEALMAERVRAMYMNGVPSYLELLLEAKSLNEFLDRIVMVKRLMSYDTQILNEMEEYKEQVDKKRVEFEEKEQTIITTRASVARQKKEIEQKKKERSALLTQLKDQEESYEQDLEELERTSKELEKKIREILKELERQRRQQNKKVQYTGGTLAWPVPGFYRITSQFGYRIHPITGNKSMHNGIDIGSNYSNGGRQSIYGQNFVAGADGTVILAGWYGGYGNCVIVEHGGGITTLYAHGSAILVSAGQRVTRGQPVLKVGSTGASTGAHAHFEVRKNGTPVNPMLYLGG